MRGKTQILTLIVLTSLLLWACSSNKPITSYPNNNLGAEINSKYNEFSPNIIKDTLYFTSDRPQTLPKTKLKQEKTVTTTKTKRKASPKTTSQKQEDNEQGYTIWKTLLTTSNFAENIPKTTQDPRFNLTMTENGSVFFLDNYNGFIVFNQPISKKYIEEFNITNITEGKLNADIYFFSEGEQTTSFVNLKPINSESWDSHPTAIIIGNYLLIIFSSDNYPNSEFGYSKPTENADLFYSFYNFQTNSFTPPQNLNNNLNKVQINTTKNEYTPFIMSCYPYSPSYLLFYSQNQSDDYDIYYANLIIDTLEQKIYVTRTNRVTKGSDEINTNADELFPFIYEKNDSLFIFFSSNRDMVRRKIGKNLSIKNVGNFDLYKFFLGMKWNFCYSLPEDFIAKKELPPSSPPLSEISYQPPTPCSWQRTIPYFQSGFWKLNIASHFEQDLQEIINKQNQYPTLIELHPRNTQYGTMFPEKRNERINFFQEKAIENQKTFDSTVTFIAHSITNFIDSNTLNECANQKLIIEITAYSDYRDILSGFYFGENVTLILDESTTQKITLTQQDERGNIQNYTISLREANFSQKTIKNGETLDRNNRNLSILRAYYSFLDLATSILELLPQKYHPYILFPVHIPKFPKIKSAKSSEEFEDLLNTSSVIFLLRADVDLQPTTLELRRRVEIKLKAIKYENNTFKDSSFPCCSD